MTFSALLAEDTTETLYPMLLPEDEDGLIWHLVEMTKEEVIATLETNSCKDDSVSELILEYNQEYITEFGVDAVKFSEARLAEQVANSASYRFSFVLSIALFGAFVSIVIGSTVAAVSNRFF